MRPRAAINVMAQSHTSQNTLGSGPSRHAPDQLKIMNQIHSGEERNPDQLKIMNQIHSGEERRV